jgi:hypothetical protein
VVAVSARHGQTCAVIASGEATCWGDNSAGQLGNLREGSLVPVDVVGF